MAKCCLCGKNIENENAPVLTMGGSGNPRLLCDECDGLLESATESREIAEIENAMSEISKRMSNSNPDDATCTMMESIMTQASKRGAAIRAGRYDFSLDENEVEGFDEIPEELQETEEDIQKDLEDEEKMKKFDKFYNIFIIISIAALAGYVIWRLVDTFILSK
jgi:hypothetical protein